MKNPILYIICLNQNKFIFLLDQWKIHTFLVKMCSFSIYMVKINAY